ncbi:putative ribosomal RNA-processing protein 7 homolog B [Microtus ochrogaster]|uniref:Ribosomal RNA-processing protein 7 homolog B n=1 Tax=Microtus ochrogaster TaxID=79684 RepID=A0ABM0LTB1_MICOH|nr:putative ribosomal RNA-processing protein 7 homolog B [Microtus ochrogaster]
MLEPGTEPRFSVRATMLLTALVPRVFQPAQQHTLSQCSFCYTRFPSPSEWISDYEDSVLDPEALRVEVDTFMEAYDKKIAEEETKAKEEEGVPDEEGWVKVTRRGRRPVLPRTEAASLRVLEKEKRKRARKELLNFYAWQHRETKMERK